MNRIIYSKLLLYQLLVFLVTTNSFGQVTLVNSGSSAICTGSSVTLSTNNTFVDYLWSTGETTASVNVAVAGSYFVTVTDSNSNTFNSDTITTTVVTIAASASITDLVCNGDNDGEIDIMVIGGTGPYTFLWSNASTLEDLTGLTGGTYTVIITDSNSCSASASFIVNEPAIINIASIITPVCCFGGNTGAINISVTGGNGGYLYDWDNSESTEDIDTLTAGTYVVTVTDGLGCVALSSNIVPDGIVITPLISGANFICPGNTTALDAGSGYSSYLWSGGETTQIITVGQGTYSVTVTTALGCSGTSPNFILNEYTAPSVAITAGGATSFCDGGSVLLTATTGFSSYLWSSSETTGNISATLDGIYTVTVSDVNGCTATASILVTVYPNPSLNLLTVTDVLCKGGSTGIIEVSGNGGSSPYLYDVNGSGFSGNSLFTGLIAGPYNITVQDVNGCSSVTQILINEPTDALAGILNPTHVLCAGQSTGSIDLTVSGGTPPYTYTWSNNSPNEDISGLAAGTYTVTVTDANGCTFSSNTTLNEPSALLVTPVATNASCAGGDGSIDVTVTGGTAAYTYTWSTGDITEDISALSAGTYTVTVTDANGCSTSASSSVSSGGVLTPPVIAGSNIVCPGATALLDAGSGYFSYSWSTGATTQTILAGSGTYSVTVSNSGGCSATSADFTITEFTVSPVAITPGGPVSFCDGGSVLLTSTAGFSSYLWSTSETTGNISATMNGTYTVTATDANGCTTTATQAVTVYPTPTIDLISLTDVLCKDDANGIIEVAGNNGSSPYLFSFNNGPFSSQSLFTGLSPNVYDIIVQDNNGCTSMTQFFINEPADYLGASYSTTDVLCFGDATGSIDLTVTGGTAPYSYDWSNAETSEDLSGLVAGTYTVTVTDAHGCSLVFAIDIFEPTQIVVGSDYTNISCFGGSDGTAIVFVSGGTPGYSYSWNTTPVQTDFIAFNLSSGLHTVTITDANGCIATQTFLIAEPPQLIVSTTVTDATCFGYTNGSATVNGTGGTPYQTGNPYTYSWNSIPVQTNATATGLEAGSYTVTLTDSTGCIKVSVVTVNEPNQLMASTSNVNVLCNGGNNGESTVIVSGGTAPYTYSWNTVPVQTTFIATGLTAGLYTVTVTDANGCTTNVNSLINQPLPLTVNGCCAFDVTCHGGSDGKVILNVTGGNIPYSYFWNTSPAQTTNNIINVIAGIYTVVVTDEKGCTKSGTFTVNEPAKITPNETITPVNCFGGNNGSVSLNVSGGVSPYNYMWSNGNTTNAITGLAGGSYTVTITDASGCIETKTFIVNESSDILIATTLTSVSCSGGSNGSAIASVSGGQAPYTYLWTNSATTSTVTGLSAGVYTLTVTDNLGCTKSATITIIQPPALSCICNANIVNVSCFGGSNGSITATPSGGTPPYSYLWSNSQVTQTANGLIAGTYSVTITDANGCQAVGLITVTQPPVLSVFATSTNINCSGASNGSGNAIASGGTPPYSYLWNTIPAQTTQVATGLPPGTFTVTVTDSKNCTAFSSATITQPTTLNCSTSSTNITCNGSSNGTATVVASNGTPPYTYLWNTIPAKTTTTVIGLSSGTYTVTITDFKGCTKTCQATVSQPSALVALYVPTNISCFGGNNGAIDLTVTGGTAPYTYSWSNGVTTQDLTGVAAGLYSVLITDHKGCNLTTIITLTQPTALVCNASSTNVNCNAGSNGTSTVAVNGGTAPYQYLWSNGNTTSSTNGLNAGTYTVTVTDNKGCTTMCNVVVTQPALLSCSVVTCCDTIACFGEHTGALNVLVTGGSPPYTYAWTTSPVQTSAIASGLGAGSYSVVVTDSKGCTTSCSYTLTQPPLLSCSATGTNVTCNGGSSGTATVTVVGGTLPYTYLWNTLVAQTTATATGLSAGTYTVFVMDANGCTTSCQVTVTNPNALNLNITQTNINCNGAMNGTATAVVSGGTSPYGYLWSNGGTTATITGLSAITYTVTVTDLNGCSASASVSITEPSGISCSTTKTDVSCYAGNNGTATVTASGGTAPLTYSWNTIPAQNTVTATGLTAGSYIVIITDANGCTTSCSATITEPGSLSCSTTTLQNATCYGGQNGSASVTTSGGTAPYAYSWNTTPVQTNATATGLAAGIYGVTVTDFNGCTTSCNVTITEPAELLCSTSGLPTNCGNDDGQATVTVTGGVPPYGYLWSDGQTTATASGLAAGDYTVTVTDLNGCTTSCTVNIGSSSSLIAIIGGTDVTCNASSDGTAFVSVAGGEPPYTYLWNTIPSQTTDTITALGAGTYTVVATDINGCTISKTITISEPTAVAIIITKTDVLCFGGNTGSATATATGGSAPYSYLWSNGQTNQTTTGLIAGSYTVTVTDFYGCTASNTVSITEPLLLSCTTSHTDPICYNSNDGNATVNATGGTTPYGYLWSDGQSTQTATGLASGTYTVTVTDANGCSTVCTATLASIAPPSCLITGNSSICSGSSTQWCAPAGLSAYIWSTGATTQCITVSIAATYTVTVTDANGCTSSCNKALIVNPLPSCLITGNGSICSGSSTQWCAPAGLSAYSWSTGATTQCITVSNAATYTVTVTNANGCTSSCNKALIVNQLPSCLITGNGSICAGSSTQWCAPAGLSAYNWSTGATTQCITVSIAATYTVTVTDANGCTSSCNKALTINSVISCNIIGTKPSCFGASNGTGAITVTGGTAPFTYLWSNGQTTQTATGLSAGIYTATVTDSYGCTTSCNVTINNPTQLVVVVTKGKDVSCYGGSDAYADANPTGGSAPYTYLWSNGATTKLLSAVAAGTYTVTVTDANGCTAMGSITLIQPSLITGTTASINVTCFGGSNGSALLTSLTGGTSPYTFSWNTIPVQTTTGATGLTAGSYIITITDANSCTVTKTVVVSQPPALTCSASSTNATCLGGNGSVSVTATGGTPGYSYVWNTSPAKTTSTVTGLGIGTYTVIVTDANGCTTSCSATVSGTSSNLSCSITKTNVSCNGGYNGSATVNVTGGTSPYSYSWNTIPVKTTATITGLTAGNYQVTVTDANGCTTICTVTISQPSILGLSISLVHVSCNGGSNGTAASTVTGGTSPYSYSWNTVPVKTTSSITGLTAGSYTLTVTDSKGCTIAKTVTITQPTAITLSFTKVVHVGCYGGNTGEAEANPSGGTSPYSFLWSNAQTSPYITGLVAGIYTVTITDSKGCTKSGSVTITQPAALSCSTTVSNSSCSSGTGSATVNATGGTSPYYYSWNTVPVKTTQTITGLAAGTYIVTVTDSKGCTSNCSAVIGSSTFTLGLVSPVFAGGKNIRCYGENNGSINLTVTGATCAVTYLWSNGKTTEDINTLVAGTYTVTVTSCGCNATGSITLTQPANLTLTTSSTNVSCNGSVNGSATVTASGGNAPYSYSWNTVPAKTTAAVTGLASGTYIVTVGDANGCTKSKTICITQPSAVNVTGTKINSGCNGTSSGSINITASGGTSPYSYLWNNGTTTEDRSGLTAGTYTVTVTDFKGCTKTAAFTISQAASITCSIVTNSNVSCNGGSNGSLTASATGGTGTYTYSWNTVPIRTTATITGLSAGTYTVTITDGQGCVCSSSKTVTQPTVLTVNTSFTNVTVYGANNGTATASPSGGTSPYTYAWSTSPVKTAQTVTGLAPGTYTVTVTDNKGCTKAASVCITQPSPCQSFKSYTVGGWGAAPSGNNPGAYLASNFSAVFPTGISIGNCGRLINLTTASAVQLFLPSGGTPRRLNAGVLNNPTSASYGNTLAGQLVALKLNMAFDAWDPNFAPSSATLFKDLIISTGTYNGWTVEQLFNEANYRIGCGGVSSSVYSALNSAVTSVNQSWDNGISTNGFLSCPKGAKAGSTGAPIVIEEVTDFNFSIYPNPTNGFVNLQYSIDGHQEYQMHVIDLTGRVVYSENSVSEQGTNGKFYDFSDLPKGIYIFKINIGDHTRTERIIIQ